MKSLKQLKNRVKALEALLEEFIRDSKRWVKSELTSWFRVEQQDQSFTSLYMAVVVGTQDPWGYNRVQFFCPMIHTATYEVDQLPWAWPLMNQGGSDDTGCTWIPPAGSVVGLIFEAGNRDSAYYIGSTWQRDRTKYLNEMGKYLEEYDELWRGSRGGYMVGPDETQVFPPWNTENYHTYDIDSIRDFEDNPNAREQRTNPHVYGWKTPEKHMIKMDDGDPRCFHRWKRMELQSSLGHRLLFKDDPFHPCAEWLNPNCLSGGKTDYDVSVRLDETVRNFTAPIGATAFFTSQPLSVIDAFFTPAFITSNLTAFKDEGEADYPDGRKCNPECGDNTADVSLFCKAKQCQPKNKYHKHRSECGLCLQDKTFLDQGGVLLMSRGGGALVIDDSVEEPKPQDPEWSMGTQPFDKDGCTGKFMGRMGLIDHTGHAIELNGSEDFPSRRGKDNGIRLHTASGIDVFLCDQDDQEQCRAGEDRGFHVLTTARHTLDMVDCGARNCSPPRTCGGTPTNDANKAYYRLRTGYGMHVMMDDATDQQQTTEQYLELFCPQKDNDVRGPHILRMQERPGANPKPMVYLRAGGEYFVQTYDDMFEMVGVPASSSDGGNPASKVEVVTRDKVVYCFNDYLNKAKRHVFLADDGIYLLSGLDCPPPPDQTGCGPCVAPVVVYSGGCLRISDRVFATASPHASPANIMMLQPLSPCTPGPECGG
jgi:hypothetical protein